MPRIVIYGAAGQAGRRIAAAAVGHGAEVLLAGRSAKGLEPLAHDLGVPWALATLDAPDSVEQLLAPGDLLLNCAGPYSRTAIPAATACLRRRAHLVDLCGEIGPLRQLVALDALARASGIMLLPAAGFTAVASDSLAFVLHRALPGAVRLVIGLAGAEVTSRGSVRTMVEQAGSVLHYRSGIVEAVLPGAVSCWLDYVQGPPLSVALSLGDIITAYNSTAIPNITAFMQGTPRILAWTRLHAAAAPFLDSPLSQTVMQAMAGLYPAEGDPPPADACVVAEVSDADGAAMALRLRTPDVHTFTTATAVAIALRAAEGDIRPGFQTASTAYGLGLVESCGGRVEPARTMTHLGAGEPGA